MQANEFVKRFGWELAKRDIAALDGGFIKREDFIEHYGFDILDDLKILVDAYELVQFYHGLEVAKTINYGEFIPDHVVGEIKQAIKLVESVYEND